jgi:hypothetical protein
MGSDDNSRRSREAADIPQDRITISISYGDSEVSMIERIEAASGIV